ncbi:unnamed protein product [Cuscuta epithymum]|uniref:Zinc finger GRF-type domain-containing protein n=1 Tax=Cuscuta epithymum TaxID=186058 RepID=A0AAV0G0P9_9ASTE|nr:unnamed protein product [Cuscuta epithymum]
MDFANRAHYSTSTSSTSQSPTRRTTLNYDPPFYCRCGLKAPVFVSRDSGRKFLGCQNWPDGGCKYFVWHDEMNLIIQEPKVIDREEAQLWFPDVNVQLQRMKDIISDFREELHASHSEIARLRTQLENLVKGEHLKWSVIGLFMVILVMGICTITGFNVY